MPTTHVEPGSGPLLQDIATTLWKARKVVVITGAGISTNSGIPDFRSENGLYSLIQAQFEAAQHVAGGSSDPNVSDASIEQRPAKRQRRSYDEADRTSETNDMPFPGLRNAGANTDEGNPKQEGRTDERPHLDEPNGALSPPSSEPRPVREFSQMAEGMVMMEEKLPPGAIEGFAPASSKCLQSPELDARKTGADHPNTEPAAVEPTAPFPSSPPTLTLGTPHHRSRVHLLDSLPGSSSPLSSPPPILFDPYQESTDCSSTQDDSSRSQSEEPSSVSTPLLSSQTSFASSSRPTLPIMKGRDLFDAQIWSCPIKTSVFYTFVSTLREKSRSAEPTTSHRFVSVLRDSRKLVRCYTQNIDQLEERVGLSTSLSLGVGSRYRFSVRAGRNSGGTKGAKSAEGASDSSQGASQPDQEQQGGTQPQEKMQDASIIYRTAGDANKLPPLRPSQTTADPASTADEPPSSTPAATTTTPAPAAPNRGVECVFLHGSLAELRCFVCARTASWDEDTRLADTLAGRQPTCPHCAGATAAREERGKRALGVGKLRPDIVLYGEEHPQAHLISPLIQHDLSLGPDMLLILGTSMRVHGLKVLVKEFAKAVHDRGGKVVFVNFTKPPESVWADVIDYWVQWDCDAWVSDLQQRKPALWLPPGSVLPEEEKPKTSKLSRRQSGAEAGKRKEGAEKPSKKVKKSYKVPKTEDSGLSVQDEQQGQQPQKMPSSPLLPTPPKSGMRKPVKVPKEPKLNPDAKRPVSTRDHKLNGAYLVWKIMEDLRRITGASPPQSAASPPKPTTARPKARKPRKSAPAALGSHGMPPESTAAEGHDTPMRQMPPGVPASSQLLHTWTPRPNERPVLNSDSSISAAVKTRKRKQTVAWRMIGGVETRISLHVGGEPETPLPHTKAVLRPSSVPKSRWFPPPTLTTPQELPPYSPLAGISQPPFALPNHASHPQPTVPSPAPATVDHAISAGFLETGRLIAQVHEEARLSRPATPSQLNLQLQLPPLNNLLGTEQDYQPHQLYHHHQLNHDVSQQRHQQQPQQQQQKLTPLEPKVVSPGPGKGISSNVGSPVAPRTVAPWGSRGHNPFFFSDPGVGWLGYPPVKPPQAPQGEDQSQLLRNHHHQLQCHMRLQEVRERGQQGLVQEQEQLGGVAMDGGTGAAAGAGAGAGMGESYPSLQQQSPHQQLHHQHSPQQHRQEQQFYGLGLKLGHEQQHQPQQTGDDLLMERAQEQQQLLPSQVLMLEREEGGFPVGGQGLGLGLQSGVDDHHRQHGKSEAWGTEVMGLGLEDQHGMGVVGSGLWCPDEQLRKEQEAVLMLSSMRGNVGEFY